MITDNYIISGKINEEKTNSDSSPPTWSEPAQTTAAPTESETCPTISSKEDNLSVQCRTVTSGNADSDVLLKFMSSVECPNPLKRCIRCQKCDQCKKTYLPDQEKNEKMIEVLKQNVLYDEKEKCYQANYVYNEEIKNLPSYETEVLRMQTI